MQWALYYPVQVAYARPRRRAAAPPLRGPSRDGFDRLRARRRGRRADSCSKRRRTIPGRGLGASIGAIWRPATPNARDAVLADSASAIRRSKASALAQLAAVALATGRHASAARVRSTPRIGARRRGAAAARAAVVDRAAPQPRGRARCRSRERALAAHPQSVGALVAASEAAQGQFDLDAARRLPRSRAGRRSARRACARQSRPHPLRHRRHAGRARRCRPCGRHRAPTIAQVRSLRGFIRLADGDLPARAPTSRPRRSATPSSASRTWASGSLHFRENQVEPGLEEMLTATLLEPKVALYQSYLGKAYYQAGRFPEGLSALASAKRLDPRDPTPWLYTSFFLRDQNQQVRGARRAAPGDRAQRSPRRLSQPAAARPRPGDQEREPGARSTASSGFEAWGAFEALNSLDADLTNSSAHLFLAETYGGLPDRTEALEQRAAPVFPVCAGQPQRVQQLLRIHRAHRAAAPAARRVGAKPARARAASATSRTAPATSASRTSRSSRPPARARGRTCATTTTCRGSFRARCRSRRRAIMFVSYSRRARAARAPPRRPTASSAHDIFSAVILRQFTRRPTRRYRTTFTSNEVVVGHEASVACGLGVDCRGALRVARRRPRAARRRPSPAAASILRRRRFDGSAPRVNRQHAQSRSTSFDLQVQQATRFGRHQLIRRASVRTRSTRPRTAPKT